MLEHEDGHNTVGSAGSALGAESSAANERVTAEEFSAAIDALEKRRSEEAAHKAGTVEVGQAIQELNVDATPEEILAEVRATRARIAAEQQAKSDAKARARQTVTRAWNVATAAYKTIHQHIDEQAQSRQSRRAARIALRANVRTRSGGFVGTIFSIVFMFYFLKWLIGSVTGGLPLSALPFSFESKPASPGVIRTLSQVPDGETVYCDTDDVVKILSDGGVVARAGSASTMTNPVENSWPIFRHAGKIYLKAYTLPTSVDKIGSSAVDLFNDNNSGDLRGVSDDSVTVPLAGADLVDSTRHDKWSELTVDNIKTDSLTQDKHE